MGEEDQVQPLWWYETHQERPVHNWQMFVAEVIGSRAKITITVIIIAINVTAVVWIEVLLIFKRNKWGEINANSKSLN